MNGNHQPFSANRPCLCHTHSTQPMSLCLDGFFYPKMPFLPISTHSHVPWPSGQNTNLLLPAPSYVWHTWAFEQEVQSLFPELKLLQHFISTSLWVQSSSYLGLDSCSRWERIIILTAGARMPLRGNCLYPGKYFYELLRIDRSEILRAGLAAGNTTKEKAKLLCSMSLKGI